MTPNDFSAFSTELTRLSEYYEKAMTEAQVALYFEALLPYSVEDVITAMRRHVKMQDQGRWWPKVADLVGLIEGDADSLALEAWTQVVVAWETHGVYESIRFDNPCIMAVVEDMGGWIAFDRRYKQLEEEPFIRNEFVKRYRGYVQRPPKVSRTHLKGVFEVENARTGFVEAIPRPMQIVSRRSHALSAINHKAFP